MKHDREINKTKSSKNSYPQETEGTEAFSQKCSFPERKESMCHRSSDHNPIVGERNFQNQHVQCLTPTLFPSLDFH